MNRSLREAHCRAVSILSLIHISAIPEKRGRAITGLSMGGHGALWNAIRHKDVFGAAGSTSGGVDIRPERQSIVV